MFYDPTFKYLNKYINNIKITQIHFDVIRTLNMFPVYLMIYVVNISIYH
jgi:hypothetical protein